MNIQNYILRAMDALRSSGGSVHSFAPLLTLAMVERNGDHMGAHALHRLAGRQWDELRDRPVGEAINEAATIILKAEPDEQLAALTMLPPFDTQGSVGDSGLSLRTAKQFVHLVDDARSVLFSYDQAAPAALLCAWHDRRPKPPRRLSAVVQSEWLAALVEGLAIAFSLSLEVRHGDPLAVFEERGDYRWDAEVSLPPFGAKAPSGLRLPYGAANLLGSDDAGSLRTVEIAALANAAANVGTRAVVVVTDSVLFRDVGAEKFLRARLLDTGQVRASIALPSGSMGISTSVRTTALVLGPRQHEPGPVRMIDAVASGMVEKGKRGRVAFKEGASVATLLETPPSDPAWGRDVPPDEIAANSNVLLAERYLANSTVERVRSFVEGQENVRLGEIADLRRARPLKRATDNEGDGYVLREASPSDIGLSGFLEQPERGYAVDEATWFAARDNAPRPNDVLITSKGAIGVVGLTPPHVPEHNADEIWTVGQSLMIARIKASAPVSPVVVYQYLSSKPVRELMRSLASGTTIANFNIKDMRALTIPVPSHDEQDRIEQEFAEMQERYDRLAQLQREVAEMRGAAWPVTAIEGGK